MRDEPNYLLTPQRFESVLVQELGYRISVNKLFTERLDPVVGGLLLKRSAAHLDLATVEASTIQGEEGEEATVYVSCCFTE
jgi:hypothetical protein